jgi:hypothetical protein
VSAPDASDRIVFCVGSINADLVMRVGGPPTGTIVADDVAVLPGEGGERGRDGPCARVALDTDRRGGSG